MHRSVRGAAWVAALAALWAYALTLSPTVAWVNLGEDSGDLLVASATLGIPHPTGYPLFVLLGRVASLALLVGFWRFSRTNRIGLWTAVLLPLLAFWGLTLDLFLPVRAAQDPEFSWGTPVTPERLWWVLSGAQYGRNFFARGLPGILNHLVPGRWGVDFGWGLVLLGTGLLLALIRRDGRAASGWAAFLASLVLP